jgi:glutamate synthase domain-containing protein 3
MASVDNIVHANSETPGSEVVRAQLTGTTSTYVSEVFNTIQNVSVSTEGTNGATYAWSGVTVTITGTNNDYVNIIIHGY